MVRTAAQGGARQRQKYSDEADKSVGGSRALGAWAWGRRLQSHASHTWSAPAQACLPDPLMAPSLSTPGHPQHLMPRKQAGLLGLLASGASHGSPPTVSGPSRTPGPTGTTLAHLSSWGQVPAPCPTGAAPAPGRGPGLTHTAGTGQEVLAVRREGLGPRGAVPTPAEQRVGRSPLSTQGLDGPMFGHGEPPSPPGSPQERGRGEGGGARQGGPRWAALWGGGWQGWIGWTSWLRPAVAGQPEEPSLSSHSACHVTPRALWPAQEAWAEAPVGDAVRAELGLTPLPSQPATAQTPRGQSPQVGGAQGLGPLGRPAAWASSWWGGSPPGHHSDQVAKCRGNRGLGTHPTSTRIPSRTPGDGGQHRTSWRDPSGPSNPSHHCQ